MGAQLYSTGPVDVYVYHPLDSTISFLGHGERAPSIDHQPSYADVHCDLGGQVPIDRIYSGEMLRVGVDLVRYDYAVVQRLHDHKRRLVNPVAAQATYAGQEYPGDIGTLMLTEGAYHILYLKFRNAPKTPFANNSMPKGYRIYRALMDPSSVTSGSTTAHKVRVAWSCYRKLDMTAPSNTFGNGLFTLYDHVMDELNNVAAN